MVVRVCGDTLPRGESVKFFSSGDMGSIFDDDILKAMHEADYRIVNLEGVLTGRGKKINKSGPSLKAPGEAVEGYKKLEIDAVSLANNHMLDYGAEGLSDTITRLEENGIAWFGAKYRERVADIVIGADGVKLGICSYAEREFNYSLADDTGAVLFDDLYTPDEVAKLKEKADYVICLYHGGPEYFRYPTPYVRKRCRKLAEKGADLVICQHSHCIGCEEVYSGSRIIYGQGNFCFNGNSNEYTDSGLMIRAEITSEGIITQRIPLIRNGYSIRMASKDEADKINREFDQRSLEVLKESFVEENYRAFALKKYEGERSKMYGTVGKGLKMLGLDFINRKLSRKQDNTNLLNTIRNESHRELLTESMGFYYGEDV